MIFHYLTHFSLVLTKRRGCKGQSIEGVIEDGQVVSIIHSGDPTRCVITNHQQQHHHNHNHCARGKIFKDKNSKQSQLIYLSPTTGPRVVSTVLDHTVTTMWRKRQRKRFQSMFWDSGKSLRAKLDWLLLRGKMPPSWTVHYLFSLWLQWGPWDSSSLSVGKQGDR